MISKIKDWFYWYGDIFYPVIAFLVLIVGVVWFLLLGQANVYKYNCNLNHRPDFYTTAFIANDTYAYNPTLFCDTLKEKMHK